MRQPGALSPASARSTNGALAEDARTFDAWERRLALLGQSGVSPSPTRAYITARAAAWLGFARESYARDARDPATDAALSETRRLVVSLEEGVIPEVNALPLQAPAPVRVDLWATLDGARANVTGAGSAPGDAIALADAEVALVRAARLSDDAGTVRPMSDVERACAVQLQIARAERLLAALPGGRAPAAGIVLQGATVAPVGLPVRRPVAVSRRRGVERVVHFAVNSSALALASRVTLGEVISMLRSHPKVNVVIRGFTDPRGVETKNRALAERRAGAVRHFLDAAALDLGRVTMEGIGTDSASMAHASIDAYAHDRRVNLAFTGPDGEPLSVGEFHALDMNHERDLQLEQDRHRPTVAHARPSRRSVR